MYKDYDGTCSFELDVQFNTALKNGLCWLPWIGRDYCNQKIRVLVVGESHYASKEECTPIKQMCDVDITADDKDYTRAVVYEDFIRRWWTSKTFNNINWSLVARNDFDGKQIWGKLAFYNFIQRPMKTVNERPRHEEFASGWRIFIDVVRILKPTVCIFVGNTAANFFNNSMATLNIKHEKLQSTKFINSAWAKEFSVELEEQVTQIHAIRHTGRYFSWEPWHRYLEEKIPEVINFLKSQITDSGIDKIENTITEECQECVGSKLSVPQNLKHKPIIACDYQSINHDDYEDAKYISIGRAQYDPRDASVKIFRRTDKRWSRQSEEVPIQRVGFMLEMLLVAILRCQENEDNVAQSQLLEEIVSPQDIDFLREQIRINREPIFESLGRIRALIDEISPEKI